MNWINIECATLDSEWFKGEEPIDRATWLCLLRYCVGQENGGEIPGCKDWPDRKWQQLCAVTKEEVTRHSRLWFWNGESLRIWAYPSDAEAAVQKKREAGRKTALKRWERVLSSSVSDSAIAELHAEQIAKRMRKERKGKETRVSNDRNGHEQ